MPVCVQSHVIQLAHKCHQGIVRTKQQLRSKIWWPGIDKLNYIASNALILCLFLSLIHLNQLWQMMLNLKG